VKRETKPFIETKTVKGRVYHYFRQTVTVDGKRKERRIRIKAEPGTQEFDRLYWEIASGKHTQTSRTTFKALIDNYMNSRRYVTLADGTKRKYRPILDSIREKSGHVDVTMVRRSEVEAIHEKYSDTPRMADHRLQVLRLLFSHAIRLEWMTHNPASGVELFGKQREYEPWPSWMVGMLWEAPEDVRHLAEVILWTGQRPNAAAEMQWSDINGDRMTILDEKRGERFEVHAPEGFLAFLATVPKAGAHIIAKSLRTPVGHQTLSRHFRAWRDGLGPTARPYVLHGLRKLAIVRLAEAGWTDAEIQAATNQSAQMVAYYRQKANRVALTKNARERGKGA
jgi:integrase